MQFFAQLRKSSVATPAEQLWYCGKILEFFGRRAIAQVFHFDISCAIAALQRNSFNARQLCNCANSPFCQWLHNCATVVIFLCCTLLVQLNIFSLVALVAQLWRCNYPITVVKRLCAITQKLPSAIISQQWRICANTVRRKICQSRKSHGK